MPKYLGIEFAKGYNRSFAEFKDEFGSMHVFNDFHEKEIEQELKKAYEIAMLSVKSTEVVDSEIVKPNGDTSRTVTKSKNNSANTTE